MDATAFEMGLRDDGFTEVATRSQPPGHATQPHAHAFDIRALVIEGEITLTVAGDATRYGPGDVFTMARGREHAETVGPDGVTTLAGRRYQA
jgi:quercetin dioxygenase-like cupin family protein